MLAVSLGNRLTTTIAVVAPLAVTLDIFVKKKEKKKRILAVLFCRSLPRILDHGVSEKLSKTVHKAKQTMGSDNTRSNVLLC